MNKSIYFLFGWITHIVAIEITDNVWLTLVIYAHALVAIYIFEKLFTKLWNWKPQQRTLEGYN